MSFFLKKRIERRDYKKVIVIVGGSGYVGKAYLKRFVDKDIFLKNDLLFVVVSKKTFGYNDGVIGVRGDITADPDKLVNKILNITGRIDIIINMAAVYSFERPNHITREAMLRDFDVNTIAPVLFTQSVVNQFWIKEPQKENSKLNRKVIVIGSQAGNGVSSREELITYAATKSALKIIFDYYCLYLEKFGIKTIFLSPGSLKKENDLNKFLDILIEQSELT